MTKRGGDEMAVRPRPRALTHFSGSGNRPDTSEPKTPSGSAAVAPPAARHPKARTSETCSRDRARLAARPLGRTRVAGPCAVGPPGTGRRPAAPRGDRGPRMLGARRVCRRLREGRHAPVRPRRRRARRAPRAAAVGAGRGRAGCARARGGLPAWRSPGLRESRGRRPRGLRGVGGPSGRRRTAARCGAGRTNATRHAGGAAIGCRGSCCACGSRRVCRALGAGCLDGRCG